MTQEFVTLRREVVERALEALNASTPNNSDMGEDWPSHIAARRALSAALEKPDHHEQDLGMVPSFSGVAQHKLDDLITSGYQISGYSIYHERKRQHGFVTAAGLVGWWRPEGKEYPQPQVEQEPAPNDATHIQPRQCAFYKRVDGKWYVWSRMENSESHRWYISPGTTESCLEPLYTNPQPKHQPLADKQIDKINRSTAWPAGSLATLGDRQWLELFRYAARAIEAAHDIK